MFDDTQLLFHISANCITDRTKKVVNDLQKMTADYDDYGELSKALALSLNRTKEQLCVDFMLNGPRCNAQMSAVTRRLLHQQVYETKGRFDVLRVAVQADIWYIAPPHIPTEIEYAGTIGPWLRRNFSRATIENEMVSVRFPNKIVKRYETPKTRIEAKQIWTILHSKSMAFFDSRFEFMTKTFLVIAVNSATFVAPSERLHCMKLLTFVSVFYKQQMKQLQSEVEKIFGTTPQVEVSQFTLSSSLSFASFTSCQGALQDYLNGVQSQYAELVPWTTYAEAIYLEIQKVGLLNCKRFAWPTISKYCADIISGLTMHSGGFTNFFYIL